MGGVVIVGRRRIGAQDAVHALRIARMFAEEARGVHLPVRSVDFTQPGLVFRRLFSSTHAGDAP